MIPLLRIGLRAMGIFSLWTSTAVGAWAQEGVRVTGRVLEQEGEVPVRGALVRLEGTQFGSVSDSTGVFRLSAVPSGSYVLSVRHLTFGTRTEPLEIPRSSRRVELTVRLSASAVELQPVVVEILSQAERELRAEGTPSRYLDRDLMQEYWLRGWSLADVLGARVPGITLDRGSRLSGVPSCVMYRRPASLVGSGCRPPLVILDGIRLSESNLFFQSIPLRDIESVTVLPSALAGVRYGTGSGWGVIRVESRRPGNRSDDEAPVAPFSAKSYDWDLEPGGHPWLRVLGGATAGSLAGLAIALGASGDCSPLNETRNEDCSRRGALTAGVATFTLPVAGGALGANLLGTTEWSRGMFALTTLVTFTPMFMGYFFAQPSGPSSSFRAQEMFGRVAVVVGVPIVATLADRAFRRIRGTRIYSP